jgi:hypothetical protein
MIIEDINRVVSDDVIHTDSTCGSANHNLVVNL